MENELVEFGKRVKHYRLLNGWSQEELAEKVGLHRTYIVMHNHKMELLVRVKMVII